MRRHRGNRPKLAPSEVDEVRREASAGNILANEVASRLGVNIKTVYAAAAGRYAYAKIGSVLPSPFRCSPRQLDESTWARRREIVGKCFTWPEARAALLAAGMSVPRSAKTFITSWKSYDVRLLCNRCKKVPADFPYGVYLSGIRGARAVCKTCAVGYIAWAPGNCGSVRAKTLRGDYKGAGVAMACTLSHQDEMLALEAIRLVDRVRTPILAAASRGGIQTELVTEAIMTTPLMDVVHHGVVVYQETSIPTHLTAAIEPAEMPGILFFIRRWLFRTTGKTLPKDDLEAWNHSALQDRDTWILSVLETRAKEMLTRAQQGTSAFHDPKLMAEILKPLDGPDPNIPRMGDASELPPPTMKQARQARIQAKTRLKRELQTSSSSPS